MSAKLKLAVKIAFGTFLAFRFVAAPFPALRNIGFPYLDWFAVFALPALLVVATYRPGILNALGRGDLVELNLGSSNAGKHRSSPGTPTGQLGRN